MNFTITVPTTTGPMTIVYDGKTVMTTYKPDEPTKTDVTLSAVDDCAKDAFESYVVCDDGVRKLTRHLKYVNGDERWFLDGRLHRKDGPAVKLAAGGEWWYLNGILHRVDGPAITRVDGDEEWYLNGQRHRVGGAAIKEHSNGKLSRVATYEHGVLIAEIKC